MGRVVWLLGAVGLVVWSLLCIGAGAVLLAGGDFARGLFQWLFGDLSGPPVGTVLGWAVSILEGLGVGVLGLIWASGAAMIGLGTYALSRAGTVRVVHARWAYEGAGDARSPGGFAMKDVTPRPHPGGGAAPKSLPPR